LGRLGKEGATQTSYQWHDDLSASSESLATNFAVVVTPINANMAATSMGGFQSRMSPHVIANITNSNDQRATACGRIKGIVFLPMAASPERSLKSEACPWQKC